MPTAVPGCSTFYKWKRLGVVSQPMYWGPWYKLVLVYLILLCIKFPTLMERNALLSHWKNSARSLQQDRLVPGWTTNTTMITTKCVQYVEERKRSWSFQGDSAWTMAILWRTRPGTGVVDESICIASSIVKWTQRVWTCAIFGNQILLSISSYKKSLLSLKLDTLMILPWINLEHFGQKIPELKKNLTSSIVEKAEVIAYKSLLEDEATWIMFRVNQFLLPVPCSWNKGLNQATPM